MNDAERFQQLRPLLFGIAYRMLGSVLDAEDVVQDAYLRWQDAAPDVESPKAWLTTVVSRLAIDRLRAARREPYPGVWLPEPLVGDAGETVELAESLSMAFLVLLETLSPVDRAVFLLHDVFGFTFPEIAPIAGKSATTCRQIAHRAREAVAARRPRFDAEPEQVETLLSAFTRACAEGDFDGLLATLTDDVTIWTDGGGKVAAAPKPVQGAERVARFVLGIVRNASADLRITRTTVNGGPGVLARAAEHQFAVVAFEFADGLIHGIKIVSNPDKLRALQGNLPPGIPLKGTGGRDDRQRDT